MDAQRVTELLVEKGTTWGLRLIGVAIALLVAWIVGGWLRRAALRSFEKRVDAMLAQFFANLIRYAVLTVAVIGCLGVFGIQTAGFAALIAAMGLAIGLAFQGTLGNFASGAMLLVFRPFKVGDVISVAGETGKVKELELFTTELVSADNRRIIVPNSEVFGKKIINLTHYPTRRVDVAVGTDYSADLDETRAVLEKVTQTVEGILDDPPPQVFLSELGDSSIAWQLRVHVKTEDFWAVHERLVRATKRALDEAKIGIPFPQQDVHLDSDALSELRRAG
jgi:small conductance mechanosensitive channel